MGGRVHRVCVFTRMYLFHDSSMHVCMSCLHFSSWHPIYSLKDVQLWTAGFFLPNELFMHSVLSPVVCFCLFQLPYFMNELTLTELDMGSATPRILGASKPSIDYRGKREISFKLRGFCKVILACVAGKAVCYIPGSLHSLCSIYLPQKHIWVLLMFESTAPIACPSVSCAHIRENKDKRVAIIASCLSWYVC